MSSDAPTADADLIGQLKPGITYFAEQHSPEEATREQRAVYGLLVATFLGYRRFRDESWYNEFVIYPLICVLMILVMWGVYWLAGLALFWLPDFVFDLVMYVPLGALLLCGLALKWQVDNRLRIEPHWDEGTINRLQIGRMEPAYKIDSEITTVFLMLMVASHVLFLHYSRSHLGVADYQGVRDAFGITADNILASLCFDAYEIYGLTVNRHVQHTTWPANSLQLFRIGVFAMVFFLGLNLYRRRTLRGLLKGFMTVQEDYDAFAEWLGDRRRVKGGWSDEMIDECLFLRICSVYLKGDYAQVRKWTRRFPDLLIDDSLRPLFVDASGRALFEPAVESQPPIEPRREERRREEPREEEVAELVDFADEPVFETDTPAPPPKRETGGESASEPVFD